MRSARAHDAFPIEPTIPVALAASFFSCVHQRCCVPNLSLSVLCVVLGGAVLAQVILLRGVAHLPFAMAPEDLARAHMQVHHQALRRHLSSRLDAHRPQQVRGLSDQVATCMVPKSSCCVHVCSREPSFQ